tara:strand:- start:188 stop:628 length:441 start_codon:yes stop_codon:yes gene_type:complete
MPRKFKRGQLRKVKEALNEQLLNEVTEEASEDETEQLSKDDVKRLFKETAEPGENKKSKRKQVNKAKKRLSKQKVIPQKTVSWQHIVGDLVMIPTKASRLGDDDYGIIVDQTDPEEYYETKIHDSRSLVLSPAGRNWYFTKNLRKV